MLELTTRRVAILYADVSGSTRLYETFGDDLARTDVASCIDVMTEVTERFGGKVLKTIGDEVMCLFADPARAAMAAAEMQLAVREAGEEGRFKTGALRIKIGWHYGPVAWRGDEVRGEAPVTAQQVIKLAKADEVLLSGPSLELLPAATKMDARFVDRVSAQAWRGEVDVWELPWVEESERTRIGGDPQAPDLIQHTALVLERAGVTVIAGASNPELRLGRSDDNEMPVHGRFTSRVHATIEFRHGRFHLRDQSTNGTVLVSVNGERMRLHREETPLSGSGTLTLGSTPGDDPQAVVNFRCE